MDILTKLNNDFVFFDGAMGTLLQKRGLKAGEIPEGWNISHPEIITEIHKSYFEAGANVVTSNTFGANPLKMDNCEQIIESAIKNAKNAVYAPEQYVALDIGPTGKLLKPLGDLDFEDAVSAFSVAIKAGDKAGADLIIIETMNDPYELKAAIIAAKESSNLPIFATFVLDENGKTMTGCDALSMVTMLESLGVSALGVNCSLGADKLKKFIPEIISFSSLPVIVNPNAGMPVIRNGETCFDDTPDIFLSNMLEIAEMGARVLGGCCGTTPEHIRALTSNLKGKKPRKIEKKNITAISSYSKCCIFDKKAILIGERINPTGKPKLKTALREHDMDYLIKEAIGQEENGADMLDVNVGLPEINEVELLEEAVKELQAVTALPLQIDTSNVNALERALRVYNGKALINSVNGKKESMEAVFPLVKKYGGAVIGLTLDENGIPATANERYEIAKRIVEEAEKYEIDKKDIIIDPLCLTVSSDKEAPSVTLDSMKLIKTLDVKVSLGISNVSFGLPKRDFVTSTFFALALQNGLDAVIMNPYSSEMMKTYRAYNALMGIDEACKEYIEFASEQATDAQASPISEDMTLEKAILKGLKKEAKELTKSLIIDTPPLEIVNNHIIPALDIVGESYEKRTSFLPQLLMSAETANVAFDVVKERIPSNESSKGDIIIATVKGDVHDIGKNIVKVILQNYGYRVHDLGKDVPPESILEYVKQTGISVVGLSALMTTTIPSMEETIKLLKEYNSEIQIMVGGAVLTPEYANMINADVYAKDAMDAVKFAKEFYKN